MFTGITQGLKQVAAVRAEATGIFYSVALEELAKDIQLGASVAVDGVCQTVVQIDHDQVSFQAMPETLNKTTLDTLESGRMVNIERAAKFGDEIGGHLVSGHVVDFVTIKNISQTNGQHSLTLKTDPKWMQYIFEKGFITLDGASLTVVDVEPAGSFTVQLIPETLKRTTFSLKKAGDKVNLEIDSQTQILVDTIMRMNLLSGPRA